MNSSLVDSSAIAGIACIFYLCANFIRALCFIKFQFISRSLTAAERSTMATFNMQEFNEILEKCKDKSQQQQQDQASSNDFLLLFISCDL